jgi:predicted aspartyl protease
VIFPFDPRGGLIVIPAAIVGPAGTVIARLALDTGATTTILDREILVSVGYAPDDTQETAVTRTASGEEIVPLVTLSRIEVLSHPKREFVVACFSFPAGTPVDGVLGLDFLQGTRLAIDFRLGILDLD